MPLWTSQFRFLAHIVKVRYSPKPQIMLIFERTIQGLATQRQILLEYLHFFIVSLTLNILFLKFLLLTITDVPHFPVPLPPSVLPLPLLGLHLLVRLFLVYPQNF